jgi:DNA-binding PadR family transcriptional regulator
MTSADLVRDFFLGFIRVHVLHHAAEEAVYGIALLAELRRHGYSVSPGTLYPLLHQLAEAGYLRQTDRTVNGKVRKYYVATPSGIAALAAAGQSRTWAISVTSTFSVASGLMRRRMRTSSRSASFFPVPQAAR